MKVFGDYAAYYDLLYREKDHAAEAAYVDGLIRKHSPEAQTVLDLGCGSGRHDLLLAERGYRVTGVDLSEGMISTARSKAAAAGRVPGSLDFRQGDIRTVRLGGTFDAVASLFHVVSYQTSNRDLAEVCSTAAAHLGPEGLFVFDCWYGPAVLTDRPSVRMKTVEDERAKVTRIAAPVLHPNENWVDVHYHLFVVDKRSGALEEVSETHRMRYLFRPEIELLLEQAGLRLVEGEEWMSGKPPGFDTWGVCWVARKSP